jgi:urea transport system substrate-binding protein
VNRSPRSRTRLVALGCAVAATLMASACGTNSGGSSGADGSGPIKVGSILDATGPLNIYGTAMADATKLAIQDINDNGGVLGRQLQLVSYDAQSDNAKYTQYATTLASRDKVSVIMGGITSASREAIRPVADRTKTLYFYNEQYEGGVCDKNAFNTGVVPSQQLAALIPYAIQHYGKKLYVIAADYNYGHISADWVKKYAEQAGGQVVNSEFIPLESSDFGSVVNNLQSARPDVVVSLLVGGNHIAFYRQFASTGLGHSMHVVSPTFGLGNEQVVLAPNESQGIVVAYPYFQELKTPTNQKFVDMWHKAYGADYSYITDSAVAVWNGWHMWAEAVEQAKSVDRDKVIDALESGITVDSPSGQVAMDGPSHHVTQSVSIAETNANKGFTVLDTKADVPPEYENSVCDLVKNPNTNKQFTP